MSKFIKLLLISNFLNGYSQNLIKNSSFESFHFAARASDSTWVENFVLNNWKKYGTVDLYCKNINQLNDPYPGLENYFQKRWVIIDTIDGNFFMGLLIDEEMLVGELSEELNKDSTYLFSMYIKFSSMEKLLPTTVSFCLSKEPYNLYRNKKRNLVMEADIEKKKNYINSLCIIPIERPSDYVENWKRVEYTYKAKGGERFIYFYNTETIGIRNHNRNKKMDAIKPYDGKYVMIDNLCLKKPGNQCKYQESFKLKQGNLDTVEIKEIISINNLSFDIDNCKPKDNSLNYLDSILKRVLKTYDTAYYLYDIVGHTDNQGDSLQNEYLSTCRANFVKDHLIVIGFPKGSITSSGQGQRNPVSTNQNSFGRALNRRVEIIIRRKRK